MERKKQILICIITATINLGVDRLTKILAVLFLKGKEPIEFLKKTIILVYTENTGAFLSLGKDWPHLLKHIILLYIPLLVCVFLFIYCMIKPQRKGMVIILISIASGGMSNLIDRIFNNFSVIDFMNFGIRSLRTGILNVADISITFGVLALIIYGIVNDNKNRRRAIAST